MISAFEQYCIVDFEASSLSGWPIEIGISQIIAGTVQTWSSLIRPAPDWLDDEWSEAAERVHGIARAGLNTAPSPADVAAQFIRHVGNRTVLSDAPEFEIEWLKRLFAAAGRWDVPEVLDYDHATAQIFEDDPARLDRAYEWLARHRAPHQAGPDAERLVRAWLHGDPTRKTPR